MRARFWGGAHGRSQTILGTATPQITNQFNSPTDIGWYTSAYLMTSTGACPCLQRLSRCSVAARLRAFEPLSVDLTDQGRMYSSFSLKWTYISSLAFFEIGSLICAVATGSKMVRQGRTLV